MAMVNASRGTGPAPTLRQALSRWSAVAAIISAFLLDTWIEATTHSDLALLLYLLPIGLTLHTFGPRPAYLLCLLAALVGTAPPLFTVLRFLLLALLVAAASHHLLTLRHTRSQVRRLHQLLPLCPDCGQLLCQDGQWRHPEQALQQLPSLQSLAYHICPSTTPTD